MAIFSASPRYASLHSITETTTTNSIKTNIDIKEIEIQTLHTKQRLRNIVAHQAREAQTEMFESLNITISSAIAAANPLVSIPNSREMGAKSWSKAELALAGLPQELYEQALKTLRKLYLSPDREMDGPEDLIAESLAYQIFGRKLRTRSMQRWIKDTEGWWVEVFEWLFGDEIEDVKKVYVARKEKQDAKMLGWTVIERDEVGIFDKEEMVVNCEEVGIWRELESS